MIIFARRLDYSTSLRSSISISLCSFSFTSFLSLSLLIRSSNDVDLFLPAIGAK